jgi:hypothetical protein
VNKTIGLVLVVYSLLLAGCSYLVYHFVPVGTQPTLIAGIVGGALCLVWGARALAGSGGKTLPLLTLIPVSFTLLPQTFMSWSAGSGGVQAGRGVAALITLLLVLSLGMLVRIAWSGMLFDLPAGGQTKEGNGQSQPGGQEAAHAHSGRRA